MLHRKIKSTEYHSLIVSVCPLLEEALSLLLSISLSSNNIYLC